MNKPFIPLDKAIETVLELARQNIIPSEDMPEEHERQTEACNTIEDFFVNNVFDGTGEDDND